MTMSFIELLNIDSSFSTHIRNIWRLSTEMFKSYKALSSPLMNIIFNLRTENPYNLRQVSKFSRPIVESVYHTTESISYLRQNIWNVLPEKLKSIENLMHFEKEIKNWQSDNCPCRLCKVYVIVGLCVLYVLFMKPLVKRWFCFCLLNLYILC